MATLAECPSTALGVYGALTTGCHLTTTYRPIVQGESKGNDTITWERMLTDIRTAAQHVRRGGKVVFFFSGHGEILQQKLCLVDTAGKTMSVDRLHAAFCKVLEDRDADATGVVLVLLLDCCQRQVKGKTPDSPPVSDQKFTLSDNTQREYFIGYATSPCLTAVVGDSPEGTATIFGKAVIDNIARNKPLQDVFSTIAKQVRGASEKYMLPCCETNLTESFVLSDAPTHFAPAQSMGDNTLPANMVG